MNKSGFKVYVMSNDESGNEGSGNKESRLEKAIFDSLDFLESKMTLRNFSVAIGIVALASALGAHSCVKSKRHSVKKEVFTHIVPYYQRGELSPKDANEIMQGVKVGYSDVFADALEFTPGRLDYLVRTAKWDADSRVWRGLTGYGIDYSHTPRVKLSVDDQKNLVGRYAGGYLKGPVERGEISFSDANVILSEVRTSTSYPDFDVDKNRNLPAVYSRYHSDNFVFNAKSVDVTREARRGALDYMLPVVAKDKKLSEGNANYCLSIVEISANNAPDKFSYQSGKDKAAGCVRDTICSAAFPCILPRQSAWVRSVLSGAN
jgi:hypothetical protein